MQTLIVIGILLALIGIVTAVSELIFLEEEIFDIKI